MPVFPSSPQKADVGGRAVYLRDHKLALHMDALAPLYRHCFRAYRGRSRGGGAGAAAFSVPPARTTATQTRFE